MKRIRKEKKCSSRKVMKMTNKNKFNNKPKFNTQINRDTIINKNNFWSNLKGKVIFGSDG